MSEDSEYIKGYRDGIAAQAIQAELSNRERAEAFRTALRVECQLADAREERDRAIMARQAEANGLRGDIEDLTQQAQDDADRIQSLSMNLETTEAQLWTANNSLALARAGAGESADLAIIRERQLIALYLHSFAGSQVDPVEVANAVLTGAHMVSQ